LEIYDFIFFQNVSGKSQVSLCINVTQSNALTMKGTIAFSGTSTRDNRPAAGSLHINIVPIVIWDYVRGELTVTFNEQTWRILKNLA
jgi:hypothetical protein